VIAAVLAVGLGTACGSSDSGGGVRTPRSGGSGAPNGRPGGSGGAGGSSANFGMPKPITAGRVATPVGSESVCMNLQCKQMRCAGGGSTTVSGTVYDPAGSHPLYNVVVYVPNAPVQALPTGATCEDCKDLYTGMPIAATLTDSAGRFTLEKVPDGTNIPLVVQIGKWRRQFTLPQVNPCTDNPMPDGMLRLPRNRMEGDIPNIAISTGSADTLECLLRRIGVDASEYVPGAGGEGRVHIFQGSARTDDDPFGGGDSEVAPNTSPPAPASPDALWNSTESLMQYDIVLLSCEGQEALRMNQQALYDYASAGGRVFASHFHYSWFNSGPYASENLAEWMSGSNDIGDINGNIVTMLANGQPFPKGVALAEWLENVGALQNGSLPIQQARHNADVNASHTPSQAWIVADENARAPGATQYFSFNTPIDALNNPDGHYCGRVVFSDLHVGAASGDEPERPVPTGCGDGELSAQEAALEFMLFDLSSCLTPDDVPPTPPTVE
jgi:hypothetical protein